MSEASISDVNPYDAPDASLDTGHDGESYQPKVFSFRGRIGRMRYLAYNTAANLLVFAALIPLSGGMAGLAVMPDMGSAFGIFYIVINLAVLVMAIMWGKRRLNDLNRSGWLMLLMIVPLVNLIFFIYLFCFSGSDGQNDYGPPPAANSMGVIILGSLFIIMVMLGIIGVLAAILIPMMAG